LLGILLDWDVRLASADGKMPARLLESLTSKAEGSFIAHAGVRLRPSPQTKGPIMRRVLPTLLIAVASLGASAALAQDCHHAKVAERGDHVMGFDHAKTKHHFLLSAAGGSIEASANDPADTESREAIRGHLEHIASMFSEGNFDAPMLIHDQVPPGVPTMKRKKALIAWKFEETEAGGRVRITSKDAEALAAIHEFLRFQIEDHQTGDPTEIPGSPSTANRKN